jgi:hypothetical protein
MKTFLPLRSTTSLALAVALVGVLGCSGGDMSSTGSPSDGGGQSDGGSGGLSFATDVYPILIANCVSCHANGSPLNLSVSAADARSKLVGQPPPAGTLCASSSEQLVVAGNSAMSILYSKVSAVMPVCGARMPVGSSPLSATDQTTIKTWIDQGAKH